MAIGTGKISELENIAAVNRDSILPIVDMREDSLGLDNFRTTVGNIENFMNRQGGQTRENIAEAVQQEGSRAVGVEGQLANLVTTHKDSLVNAINEVKTDGTANTQAIAAEESRSVSVEGQLANLATTAKDNLVNAINDTVQQISVNSQGLANETARAVGVEGYLQNLVTTDKDSLVDAINEVKTDETTNTQAIAAEGARAVGVETELQDGKVDKQAIHANGSTAIANSPENDGFSVVTTQSDTGTHFRFETNTLAGNPVIGGMVGRTAASPTTGSRRLLFVVDSGGNIKVHLRKDKSAPAQASDLSDDDLILNKGEIQAVVNNIMAALSQGLKTPGVIGSESNLPTAEDAPNGTYYVVQNLDVTAPGQQGRVWKNDVLSETEWQVVIDNVFAPDEEWIALNTDGALTIEAGIQELINGALQSSQVEQTLPTEDSADDESKLISRRAAFGLVPKQWNQADAGKTLIIGNDGTLMPGKPALLAEGAATDDVIGTRALADEDADPTLVSVTAKKQLSWLQWMRNNLKWLLSARNLHKGDTNTAGILIDLGQETLITQEIIFNIIYNETNAGNLVRQASIHGQVYGGAGNRTGMVQNGNAPVDVFYFKGTPEGIGNTHSFLWIPNSAAARFPSAMAEAWFGQSTGNMSKMTVSVSTLAAAPAETLVPITPQAIANTWVDVPYTAEDGFDASGFRVKYNAALNIMRIHFEGNVVTTFSIGMRLFTVTLPKSISYTRRGFMSLGIYNSGGTQTGRNPSSIDVTTSGAINIYPQIYDQASGAVPAFNKCRLYGDVWVSLE